VGRHHDGRSWQHHENAGGPGDGLLGLPGSVAGGRASSPGAGDPRRRHPGFNRLISGAAGWRAAGRRSRARRRASAVTPAHAAP
jgi:hypothetical protein